MSIEHDWTEAELDEANAILEAGDTNHSVDFILMLDEWARAIAHLEGGFLGVEDEYTNDLYGRDDLQLVLENASSTLKPKLIQVLEPLDTRFKAVTTEISKPLKLFEPQLGFWWYRVPARLGESDDPWARPGWVHFYTGTQE